MNAITAKAAFSNRFASSILYKPPARSRIGLQELMRFANGLHKDGRLDEAEGLFHKILERVPNHAPALLSLGIVAHQRGAEEEAERLIRLAIAAAPRYPQAFNNLGNTLTALGRHDDAITEYNQAIALRPNYADALFNLGSVYRKTGQTEAALGAFQKCAEIDVHRADVHYQIGLCHRRMGNRLEAQIAFEVALSIDPEHAMAQSQLGRILTHMGRCEEALVKIRAALEGDPDNPSILNALCDVLKRTGEFDEALDALQKALHLDPYSVETMQNLASTHQSIGEIDKAALYYELILQAAPHAEFAEKSALFVALNNPELTSEELFSLHRNLRGRHDKPEVRSKRFVERDRDPERRLRIGYLSSDFRTHVVALNMMPLVASHDRSQFDIRLYSQEKSTDRMTQVFRQLVDGYTAIDRYSDEEVAEIIERDEIDILVTLAGRFDENRPLIATWRPAPIQVSFHDCATSGLEAYDYLLTDGILHPRDTVERHTEQLYRLPVYYQYPQQEGLPDLAPPPVLANGHITFGSFNKPEKLNDQVIALWARVLQAVPGSKLMLKYFNHYSETSMRRRWIEKFAAHDISEDRLILDAAVDNRSKHLSLYNKVDIALDPFPFNGATTTFEALSMGIPVVSLLGRHFVDRVAASMVTHAGLPELVAATQDDYVALATGLANDTEKLTALRRVTRDKLHASPLCNGTLYAQNVEAAYRDMWRTWCATGGYRGR